jgi:type IV fimbrial biogenesis protein FimT
MDSLIKTNGITLIELLVTIAVIGVIVAIGLPQFNGMIKNNALVTNTNTYIALLNYARTEAVTRETNVVLCATTDSTAAKPNCNSNNWENGWVLFSDVGNTPNNFDNNDVLLKRAPRATIGSSIRSNFTTVGKLTFAKTGLASSAGIISFCDNRGKDDSRAISVSRVGRVSPLGRGSATQCPTI